MSDTCLNCGGLIPEIGVTYGYAGKFCHCPVYPDLRFQRPASKEVIINAKDQDFLAKIKPKKKSKKAKK